MAKVGLRDMALALSKKKGLELADAEKYVETFFLLIEEALVADKIVKVKGLGTFKLVEVRDRESVDVNTGDRVIIDGHSKVSFQPDSTLKELVNKPFSQFETVMLNDGVDFDSELSGIGDEDNVANSDNALDEDNASNSTSDVPQMPNGIGESRISNALADASLGIGQMSDGQGKGAVETSTDALPDGQGVVADEYFGMRHSMSASPEKATKVENNSEATPNAKREAASEAFSDVEPDLKIPSNVIFSTSMDTNESSENNDEKEENEIEPHVDSDGKATESVTVANEKSIERCDSEDITEDAGAKRMSAEEEFKLLLAEAKAEGKAKRRKLRIAVKTMAAILLVVAIFFVGYSLGESSRESGTMPKSTAPQVRRVVVRKTVVKKAVVADTSSLHKEDTLQKSGMSQGSATADNSMPVGSKREDVYSTECKDSENAMANAKRAVKTGAYTIDGTDRSIKVKQGETLEKIARTYLGEGMECYIVVHNNKSVFKPGDSMNIPKLRLKKKATNKKVS